MWSKLLEAIYDTLVFVVFMGIIILLFVFGMNYLMGRAYSAPAPLPKRVKSVQQPTLEQSWHGVWYHQFWGFWQLHFMPNGKYAAVGPRIYEGSWRVDREQGMTKVTIVEYPAGSPEFTHTWVLYAHTLSKTKPE